MRRLAPRLLSLLAISLFLSATAGCSDPLPPDKQQYAGVWTSHIMYLQITPGGTVNYKRQKDVGNTELSGIPIQTFADDHFIVGIGPAKTRFVIDEPPHQTEGGSWKMTVDGVELTRKD